MYRYIFIEKFCMENCRNKLNNKYLFNGICKREKNLLDLIETNEFKRSHF